MHFRMKLGPVVLALWISHLSSLEGYKILLIPAGLDSHQIYFSRFGEELVKLGHHVTFVIGDKKNIIPEVQVRPGFIFVEMRCIEKKKE